MSIDDLLDACAEGNAERVAAGLDRGLDPNSEDEEGHSCLHLAACSGSLDSVRLLLDRGAALEAKATPGYEHLRLGNALYYAAASGYAEIVRVLAQRGAKVDSVSPMGVSGLMLAAEHGNTEVTSALLELQADLHLKDADDMTALHHAAVGGSAPVAHLLLGAGAQVNAEARFRTTPLDIAERQKHPEFAAVLRAAGGRNRS